MATTTKTASQRTPAAAKAPSGAQQAEGTPQDALSDAAERFRQALWPTNGADLPDGTPLRQATALIAGAERMLDSVAQIQAEVARFGAKRMHRAIEAQMEIMGCRSPDDLRSAQEAYLRDIAEDYAQEWNRLFGYGVRASLGQPVPPPPEPEDEHHATPV